MKGTGRNDPCPCGSGRKYKKCCGDTVVDMTEVAYHRLRRIDGETTEKLLRFARQRFGEDVFEEAWCDYWFSDDIPLDYASPEFYSFSLWFLYCWRPSRKDFSNGVSIAERLLREKGRNLSADERSFIEATLFAPYSFYQVLDVVPGVCIRLKDVMRRAEFEIQEKSGTEFLYKGLLLLARVVEMDDIALMMGCASQPLKSENIGALMDLRKGLEDEHSSPLSAEVLRMHEEDLREFYFDLCDGDRNQKIEMCNTNGEPFVLHTMKYRIPSADDAFQALKGLQQKVSGETDEEMTEDAERDVDGKVIKATINWLKKGNRKNPTWENTLFGTLTIEDKQLLVEVNSAKRATLIRKQIDRGLKGSAELLSTEKHSAESMTEECQFKSSEQRDVESAEVADSDEMDINELPETQDFLREMTERHWEDWPEHPLPALRGLTPRQAAKDPEGRELLEALLLDFESKNNVQPDSPLRVDVEKLRRKLRI